MTPFHLYLYGSTRPQEIHQPAPGQPGPFESSFEAAAERLQAIRGISLEPDGSFGFASNGGRERLFGMLYDAGSQLQYIDLQGSVSFTTWRQIVIAICGDTCSLQKLCVLQLPTRQLKTFQSFEAETWASTATSSDSENDS